MWNFVIRAMFMLVLSLGAVATCGHGALAIEEGDPAPDFTLIDLVSEQSFSLSDYQGQVICINFWAYW